MAEHLDIIHGTKEEKYLALVPQIRSVIEGEPDMIAKMANVASMIHETFGFWWTGFYRVCQDTKVPTGETLVLGPFQGPLACVRIRHGKGVCGTCWAKGETVIVPDVEAFPGHIACSSASRSEIVVPLIQDQKTIGVLDIDSEHLATFDDTDRKYLEQIAHLLCSKD